jgi:hypothetical protein
MGKIIPWSPNARNFSITTGSSAGLNWGPQALNGNPLRTINLGVGGAPCSVTLTSPGTYLLLGRIHFAGDFEAGDELNYGMFDEQQEVALGDITTYLVPMAFGEWDQEFTRLHTINSQRNIVLFASNLTENRGGVIGLRTGIQWVRLN